jgi:hypothetical protein
MASKKESKPRKSDIDIDDDQIDIEDVIEDLDDQDDQDEIEQKGDTRRKTQKGRAKRDTGPPVFDQRVRIGNRRTAEPLAASAMARFDPNERHVQLSEHYVFRDPDIRKRGYI